VSVSGHHAPWESPGALDASRADPPSPASATRQAVHATSIAGFPRREWNTLVAEPARDWYYFQAIERLGLPGFSPLYFGLRSEGRLRGAIAGFLLDGDAWPHAASIDPSLARALRARARHAGGRAIVIGSPLNESCSLAAAADADSDERRELLEALLQAAEGYGQRHGCETLAVKDVDPRSLDLWSSACARLRLKRVRRAASAWLREGTERRYSWYRTREGWREACASIMDGLFGFDLHETETSELLAPRSRKR
jgi:hypothetical protein